jgi:cation/acetate symporter
VTYEFNAIAVAVFAAIVGFTLGLSFYLGKKARSASGFFAAGGGIHWFVNGVAFAGDYLSAASFLGICGMIAFYGYDGFLYSIGYLAGWVVALFVIAEPLKRMGKYTFADALDSRFHSRGIKLSAAISTLAVSVFYLIPQMVGAGALVKPLFGLPHWAGVVMVGTIVILIVVSAGMVSTTWVQFLKGSLLVGFSAVLVGMILNRGFVTQAGVETVGAKSDDEGSSFVGLDLMPKGHTAVTSDFTQGGTVLDEVGNWRGRPYVRVRYGAPGPVVVWRRATIPASRLYSYDLPDQPAPEGVYVRTQTVTVTADGRRLIDGLPQGHGEGQAELRPVGQIRKIPGDPSNTGSLGPFQFFRVLAQSEVVLWKSDTIHEADGSTTTVYYPEPTSGSEVLRPGNHPAFRGIRSDDPADKLNFLSLMLALFCGTASLPHILIRYYTVPSQAAARKSTIVGITSIGFFYVLTLYMGLGAMTSGAMDVTDSNMAAPLLARSFNEWLFAVISAIAFTTVLGTVSGLIIAASGAVVHDLMSSVLKIEMHDSNKVRVARIASVAVGGVAILLGIAFERMNVNYLVGWAFSVAASANLPSLVMLLFWKGTTKQGITAAILVGMVSSLAWILLSGDTYRDVYGLPAKDALVPFSQPGIVTIPLGFATLVVVSLLTRRRAQN